MNKAAQKFDDSLKLHIKNVQEAGRKFGVAEYLLRDHDLSKWDSVEFDAYATHFHGGGDPKNFPLAWLHHVHNNPHHWQHWIFPDGWTMEGSAMDGACIEMPYEYVLEMIADWMGASKTYTGSWDMAGWLSKNIPRITVHSKTAQSIREILDNPLGYADVVWGTLFKNGV